MRKRTYERSKMQVSRVALGLTLGILWACSFAGIGLIHAIVPTYGAEFFRLMGSIYPGITGAGNLADIVIGMLYGLADGFFFGFVMAWLYNALLGRVSKH